MNNPWSQTIEQQQPSAKPEWLTEEIERTLKQNGLPLNKDGMLMLWKRSKELLDHFKEEEMQYRKICAAFLVPAKTEGTTTVELGNDFKAKVNHKYNYSLKKVPNATIWASLDKIKSYGNIGPVIADRLVSWTPNFLKTEYNNLLDEAETGNENAKAILKIINDEMLTIEEAAPTLEIKEPKKK
jgi:hypothetical protein